MSKNRERKAAAITRAFDATCGLGVFTGRDRVYAGRGTGFFIHESGWIATAAHVARQIQNDRDNTEIYCFWNDNRWGEVEITMGTDVFDVAICKVKSDHPFPQPIQFLQQGHTTLLGEDVRFIGSMLDISSPDEDGVRGMAFQPFVRAGIVSAIHDHFYFTIDSTALPGDSGSAVIDAEYGNVIGIAQSISLQKLSDDEPTLLRQYTHAVNTAALTMMIHDAQIKGDIPKLFPDV